MSHSGPRKWIGWLRTLVFGMKNESGVEQTFDENLTMGEEVEET